MKRATIILFAITAVLLTACDYDSPYSAYRANFIFDKSVYPYYQVDSYGLFICVKRSTNSGEYKITDATGRTQTMSIPEMQLQMNPFHYGQGGLIIGRPTNCDEYIWAYDWACPLCDSPSKRVEIDYTTGHATCPKCATKFDLNSGGIAIEGKSRPLWRYHVYENNPNVIIRN